MNILFTNGNERSFGTFPLKGAELRDAIHAAAKAGYRSFDTAQMYGNESDVGAALASLDLPRESLCVITKVHPDNFPEERFFASVRDSLRKLQVQYVDVLLLHWPPISADVVSSLRLLERAAKDGLARNIGVSNYTSGMMRLARETVSLPLVTNQVEFHPLLDQRALLQAAAETGIPLSSYCSLARGAVFKHALFAEIGARYGKSTGQVALRWILQKGVPVTTMSTKPDNIRANFEVMDFTLSCVDMARIEALNQIGYRIVDRNVVPWAPTWD